LTIVPFESLGSVSYSSSMAIMAVSLAGFFYPESNNGMTLKSGLGAQQ